MTNSDTPKNLRTINLNLLPILRELLRHKSVTRAAEELNLTQSAVSNCLRKLRDHFEDELLVKDGRELRLTDKARSLIEPVKQAHSSIQKLFDTATFEPKSSTRRFCIATADYAGALAIPHLANILPENAPNVRLQMINVNSDFIEQLRIGSFDLVIAPPRIAHAGGSQISEGDSEFRSELLINDPLVCIGPADDPTLANGISFDEYLARSHVTYFLDRDYHGNLENLYFDELNIDKINQVLVSDFLLLPVIVSQSKSLAVMPRSLVRLFADTFAFQVVDVAIELPVIDLCMIWSRESEMDEGLKWLRGAIKAGVADTSRRLGLDDEIFAHDSLHHKQ